MEQDEKAQIHVEITRGQDYLLKQALKKLGYASKAEWAREKVRDTIREAEEKK